MIGVLAAGRLISLQQYQWQPHLLTILRRCTRVTDHTAVTQFQLRSPSFHPLGIRQMVRALIRTNTGNEP